MLRPWTLQIVLHRNSATALHLQIARAIAEEIRSGRLAPAAALPGTRELAARLQVSRQTAVQAYDELVSQGWLVSEPTRGTFVDGALTLPKPSSRDTEPNTLPVEAGFPLRRAKPDLAAELQQPGMMAFDDGLPDARLLPVDILARAYRRMLRDRAQQNQVQYGDPRGSLRLRQAIAEMLKMERGISCTADNICVVRGSQMGIYLAARLLGGAGDTVVAEQISYKPACEAFRAAGSDVAGVGLDADGLRLDELEAVCRRRRVRAVYVTPHHQFPTTVTMRPDRRLHLLALAEQFGFAIVEDDYDHEFHFEGRPMLPLMSADRRGRVVYIGSLSKLVSPGLRIGYIAAPASVIEHAAAEVMVIDRQGDPVMEMAIAEMMQAGVIKSHARRVLRVYAGRRLAFTRLLDERLRGWVSYDRPAGGLALWVRFHAAVDMDRLLHEARRRGLILTSGAEFAVVPERGARRKVGLRQHDRARAGASRRAAPARAGADGARQARCVAAITQTYGSSEPLDNAVLHPRI